MVGAFGAQLIHFDVFMRTGDNSLLENLLETGDFFLYIVRLSGLFEPVPDFVTTKYFYKKCLYV